MTREPKQRPSYDNHRKTPIDYFAHLQFCWTPGSLEDCDLACGNRLSLATDEDSVSSHFNANLAATL